MSINTKMYIEKYIKIRNKFAKIVPLILNKPQQRLYDIIKLSKELGIPVRIIILKARQMGFSTLTESILFKETSTKRNINTGIVAHKEDATNNLFTMSKFMYDNLPDAMKPSKKASNAKILVFDNDEGTGLNSKIKCMTAGADGIGRSDTFNNLHLSELAFWPGDVKKTLLGLLQSVPNTPNSMIIIESTPNGFEQFQKMWSQAVNGESDFIPLFVGWNELDEYRMQYTNFELTEEEKELQINYNLDLEQLTWRRWCIKNNCDNDVQTFKQEYPINSLEAFIGTGDCYFNKEIIIDRIDKIQSRKPIKKGFFSYEKNDTSITNIQFNEDTKGYIEIYEDVEKGHPYVLGGDTAGLGSDRFTGQVIDNSSGHQVATLKRKLDEDEYARQMYCLGAYYNYALIGIEINFSTYPVKKLSQYNYPNIYIREIEDNMAIDTQDKFGFKTTKLTRPIILSILKEVFRDHISWINDLDTLYEALVFIVNEKGKAEAEQGEHDDLIMALAIVHYIRTQQRFDVIKVEQTNTVEVPFELRDSESYSDEIIGW